MKAYADQIRAFVPGSYTALGTDGFGRSDYRRNLRRHFEVDRHFIAVTALRRLADEGVVTPDVVAEAIEKYGIDPDRADPAHA
jgi:pyruvate dehydrogenase E1 component